MMRAIIFVSISLSLMGAGCIANAAAAQTCDSLNDEPLRDALTEAGLFISKTWTIRGPDWLTAYDTPEVRKNPFATKADESGAAASHGLIWARDVACTIANGTDADVEQLTYAAAAFRFNEDGKGWTKLQKNGVIIALDLIRKNGQWSISDKSAERSIILPENVLRLPKADELPLQGAWPDKRCKPPHHWEGKACVEKSADGQQH